MKNVICHALTTTLPHFYHARPRYRCDRRDSITIFSTSTAKGLLRHQVQLVVLAAEKDHEVSNQVLSPMITCTQLTVVRKKLQCIYEMSDHGGSVAKTQ